MKSDKYCIVSCGHNFFTFLDKRVGQIGECDKCDGYPMVTITKVIKLENEMYEL
jgi:hypothetical protein